MYVCSKEKVGVWGGLFSDEKKRFVDDGRHQHHDF